MATIPDIGDFRIQAPRPAGGVASAQPREASFADFQNSGRALQDAANTILATNERQDILVAQSASNELAKRAVDLQVNPDGGFAMAREGAAVGQKFLDDYSDKFKAAQEQVRGTLQSPSQQRIFDQHAEVAALKFRSSLLSHQAQQTEVFNERTENDTIDLARRGVFQNPGDPAAVSAALAQMDWAINQKAKRLGWSDATTAATKEKYLGTVYVDTVDQMVERDPLGTLPLLNKRLGVGEQQALTGNAAIDGLDSKHLVDFRHRAEAYRASLLNRQEADGKAALKDAEKAVEEAQKFVLTGQMISPEYRARLKAKTAGTPLDAFADDLVQLSYAGAGFGSRTIGDQKQLLRQFDAEAARGSSPEQAELIKLARSAHESQVAAYKENPWAAAARFGRQPDVPEEQIASPDQVSRLVQARAGVQSRYEQYADGPISPLQPNEAERTAKLLRTLPPEQAASVLSEVGMAAGDPRRISALATQLSKTDPVMELQMLAAGDKTTAGRYLAELIGRGALALADKTIKPDDAKATGWKSEIANLVNGTLNNPQEEEKVKQAAYYVRAAMEDKSSVAPGFSGIGQSSAESAVRLVIGQPITRGGVKTVLPRGMSESDFNAALEKYTPDTLASMSQTGKLYFGGRPVEPAVVSNRIGSLPIVRFGAAGYAPLQNGRPFTLDEAGSIPLVLKVVP